MLAYFSPSGSVPFCLMDAFRDRKLESRGRGAGNGKVYYFKDNSPTPEQPEEIDKTFIDDDGTFYWSYSPILDLRLISRETQMLGSTYLLGDEQVYYAPCLRVYPDGMLFNEAERWNLTDLPQSYVDGKPMVKPRYIKAYSFWDKIVNSLAIAELTKSLGNTIEELEEIYSEILATNYYITKHDVRKYGLICKETMRPFLEGVGDYPKWCPLIASALKGDAEFMNLVIQKKN